MEADGLISTHRLQPLGVHAVVAGHAVVLLHRGMLEGGPVGLSVLLLSDEIRPASSSAHTTLSLSSVPRRSRFISMRLACIFAASSSSHSCGAASSLACLAACIALLLVSQQVYRYMHACRPMYVSNLGPVVSSLAFSWRTHRSPRLLVTAELPAVPTIWFAAPATGRSPRRLAAKYYSAATITCSASGKVTCCSTIQ
jgi:hypothetical protein